MSEDLKAELLAIAAALLEWEEFGGDEAMRAENSGWAQRVIAGGDGAEHSGDCTNQCWTCERCLTDGYVSEARRIVNSVRRALQAQPHAANYPEIPDSSIQPHAGGVEAEERALLLDVAAKLEREAVRDDQAADDLRGHPVAETYASDAARDRAVAAALRRLVATPPAHPEPAAWPDHAERLRDIVPHLLAGGYVSVMAAKLLANDISAALSQIAHPAPADIAMQEALHPEGADRGE